MDGHATTHIVANIKTTSNGKACHAFRSQLRCRNIGCFYLCRQQYRCGGTLLPTLLIRHHHPTMWRTYRWDKTTDVLRRNATGSSRCASARHRTHGQKTPIRATSRWATAGKVNDDTDTSVVVVVSTRDDGAVWGYKTIVLSNPCRQVLDSTLHSGWTNLAHWH